MSSRAILPGCYFLFVFLATASVMDAIAQKDLGVISGEDSQWLHYTDARNALYHHLAEEAYTRLDERRTALKAISSLSEWQDRQQWVKTTLLDIVGPFPEKTPLNASVVRTVEKDFFRVEHIIFEAQPKFFVTASLFIPQGLKRRAKAPAIIYCSGHSNEGYRSRVYQHVILNLVKKGFIVFAFDPVGQGERLEYFDPLEKRSLVGGPTSEHSYPGTQAFITGSSQAKYMIWDGIRAVDYLLTRPEVDGARIGITGRSGGGTQSAYIAAFDERIKAAAPECYITSFTRLLQSIGPQDAEQNFFHGIARGIDHGDLLLVRAPRPALMITTTRDMFSIQGARETAAEVSRIYQAYQQEDHFAMVEDDAPHASTEKNREAMYAFFQNHLALPGSASDEEVALLTEEELRVTATGQVSTSLRGETVHSLNRLELLKQRRAQESAPSTSSASFIAEARRLSGFREAHDRPAPVFTGRVQREGYVIEKYFLKGEGDYVIPYLLMIPAASNHKSVLYLHPGGKAAEAGPGGEIEVIVRRGFTVMAPDLPGTGELGPGSFRGDAFIGGISHNVWYTSLLIGRSIVGLQAGDVGRLLNVLRGRAGRQEIYAVARKELTPLLIHAAAFFPEVERVALIEPLSSYRSLVLQRSYYSPFIPGAVAGMLEHYDLPDLAASLAPRKLALISAINGAGQPVTADDTQHDLGRIKEAYHARSAAENLTIRSDMSTSGLQALLEDWSE